MPLCLYWNFPPGAQRLTLQKARTLLALQRRVIDHTEPASRPRCPASAKSSSIHDLLCAPLRDAIEAALGLADSAQDEGISERLKNSSWFPLAALGVADAGVVAPKRAFEEHPDDLAHRRAQQACLLAKSGNTSSPDVRLARPESGLPGSMV